MIFSFNDASKINPFRLYYNDYNHIRKINLVLFQNLDINTIILLINRYFYENFSEMKLDITDKKILNYLQQDCKQTNKELSSKLNLSVTAVYERIKKLERAKVITRYVSILDKEKVGLGFIVFCQIKLTQHSREYLTIFETEVKKFEEVVECFHVSGEYDYLLKVIVKDMVHFRSFMVTKLTTISHIGSTQSSFNISEVKNTTAITLN